MSEFFYDELLTRYPKLSCCIEEIKNACGTLFKTIQSGGKILLCGNGGSGADCEHISGELLKGFLRRRPLSSEDLHSFASFQDGLALAPKLQYGICAIPLSSFSSVYTAFCNDVDPEAVYAQLVFSMGRPGDTIICITTSGNSKNIYNAAITAKARNLSVIGLTGKTGGSIAPLCDSCIRVPETETFKVQELHLPVYHCICAALEAKFFND